MTHPSGLQYSYDDLDLVCCHGVGRDGLYVGSGALKQGRRTRCSSMPEGCQLPSEHLGQTTLVEAFDIHNVNESGCSRQTENNARSLNFEETVHKLVGPGPPQRNSKSAHLAAINSEISAGLCCSSNSNISIDNTSFPIDNQIVETLNNKGVIGTESRQVCIFRGDDVFEGLEKQQYISISPNKGLPLSESAGEQPGKLPTHQQTKESHTEGYSRSPEISEVTLDCFAGAEQEPQTNCPDVEENISTSDQAGARGLIFVLQNSTDTMEDRNAIALPNKSLEPFLSFTIDEECDKGSTKSQSMVIVPQLGGLNELETKNENRGLNHLRNVKDNQNYANTAVALDQSKNWNISKDIVNLLSAAQQELQTDCPEVEGIISTPDQAGAGGPVSVLQNLADTVDSDNALSVQPAMDFSLDEQCEKFFIQSQSTFFAHMLNGLNDSETLNENMGLTHHSINIDVEQDSNDCAVALDEDNDCETLNKTLVEQHDVAKTAGNLCANVLKSPEHGASVDTFQTKVKNLCLATIKTVSSEHQSIGNSEKESMQTSTSRCDESQSLDNMVQNLLPKELATCKKVDLPLPIENTYLKLLTIPEIHLVEADDDTLAKSQNKTKANIIENPVYNIHLDNKYQATEQHTNHPVLSKEANEGLHGNQTSSLNESPCSEVTDGHRENHSLERRVSAMGELDEAIFSAVSSNTTLSSSDVRGTHETEDQKEDSVLKVQMRKVSAIRSLSILCSNSESKNISVKMIRFLTEKKCLANNLSQTLALWFGKQ